MPPAHKLLIDAHSTKGFFAFQESICLHKFSYTPVLAADGIWLTHKFFQAVKLHKHQRTRQSNSLFKNRYWGSFSALIICLGFNDGFPGHKNPENSTMVLQGMKKNSIAGFQGMKIPKKAEEKILMLYGKRHSTPDYLEQKKNPLIMVFSKDAGSNTCFQPGNGVSGLRPE